MSNLKINLLLKIKKRLQSKRRVILATKLTIYSSVFLIILFFTLSFRVIFSSDEGGGNFKRLNFLEQLRYLTISEDKKISGEKDNRINILLLGIGGEGHEGGNLADTIILVSFNPSQNQIGLLSLPRDLVVPIPGYGWRKINNIYAISEAKKEGSGGDKTSELVGQILDLPIHYYISIDFDGFEKIINDVGGIDVYVERTLDDYNYPTRGKEYTWPLEERFEHLHIEQGWQHMDGELALKYVRSRYAIGVEGSDFARSRRQQIVLTALKEKAFSLNTLLNPRKMSNLLRDLSSHINTNLEIWEMLRLAKLGMDTKEYTITPKTLDNTPAGLLVAKITPDGAYILEPRSGNFNQIQAVAKNIFSLENLSLSEPVKKENIKIEIQNGTRINGLAQSTALKLKKQGYLNITKISNALNQDYEKTVIYDLTSGQSPEILKDLKELLDANVAVNIPNWMSESFVGFDPNLVNFQNTDFSRVKAGAYVDFLIILGKSSS